MTSLSTGATRMFESQCFVALFVAALASPVMLAQCPPAFAPSFGVAMGAPKPIMVGDFNHDGRMDLASGNTIGGEIIVRFAHPSLPNDYNQSVTFTLGTNPMSGGVADFNHDGVDDLAIGYLGGGPPNQRVAVILSNGNMTFQAPVLYPVPTPTQIDIVDFNHDGNPDLSVFSGAGSVSVLLGNANGTFQPASTVLSFDTAASLRSSVAYGDINGDGAQDMIVPHSALPSATGYLGVALGVPPNSAAFGPLDSVATGIYGTYGALTGRFNGDNALDVLCTSTVTFHRMQLYVNTGSGSPPLSLQTTKNTGVQPQYMAKGDFNGDGLLDVAVTNFGSGSVGVLVGDGAGGLSNMTSYAVGTNPTSLAAADMNGDGKPDIVAGVGSGGAAILLNTTPVYNFSQQPVPARVCPNGAATFMATGFTNTVASFTYQWQYLNGTAWTNLTNATIPGLGVVSFGAPPGNTLFIGEIQGTPGSDVTRIRCLATTTCGTLVSNNVPLYVIRRCGVADVGGAGGVYSPCGDGLLDNNDFVAFVNLFFDGHSAADVGSQGGLNGGDGLFDNNDFVVYVNQFFAGC